MECNDDQWIRLFNVSDPRRAYAGHTLYKVTSKVTIPTEFNLQFINMIEDSENV